MGDFKSDQAALATGDFNGDGFADVLAGARFGDGPDNGREDAGEAYVIFGSAHPPAAVDLAKGEQDVTIWGESAGDALGLYVATPDLDGDGFDDIVVGAPYAKSSTVEGGEPGKVYVFYGRANLPGKIDLAKGGQDVTLIGATSNGFFGDSLASGDVNGDKSLDLIVGATFEGHSPSGQTLARAGAAYVVYGGGRWPAQLEMAAQDYDVAVYGAEEFDELGDMVTSADLNADGFDDVVITAEAADGPDNSRPLAAEVHVVFGSADLHGVFLIAKGGQDVSVLGADAQDTLGFALTAGDLNWDGTDDVVMGARLASGFMNQTDGAGDVYVLFGSSHPKPLIDLAEGTAGLAAYYGADTSDFLGGSLATGDLNGDGKLELIIAAPFGGGPDNSRAGAGDVYIVARPEPGVSASIDSVPLAGAIFGATVGSKFGGAVAAGDFNGDGRDEVIAAAPEEDGPGASRPNVGRIYVVSLGG